MPRVFKQKLDRANNNINLIMIKMMQKSIAVYPINLSILKAYKANSGALCIKYQYYINSMNFLIREPYSYV